MKFKGQITGGRVDQITGVGYPPFSDDQIQQHLFDLLSGLQHGMAAVAMDNRSIWIDSASIDAGWIRFSSSDIQLGYNPYTP